jgi:predicted amidohydrolase
VLVRARALENQMTVAYANHTGEEEGCDFRGGSIVAGADGTVLAAAGPGTELLFAELGGAGSAAAGRADDEDDAVAYLRDRRPDIYRSWGI